jgi:hypothetical protein
MELIERTDSIPFDTAALDYVGTARSSTSPSAGVPRG